MSYGEIVPLNHKPFSAFISLDLNFYIVGFTDMTQSDTVTLWPNWVSRGLSKHYPIMYKYTIPFNTEGANPRI